ncbi:MAG: hypothetical protein EF813_06245 [Methanosarcinales archaeon]|nr:MAG: hypothetical protein EF813_06245 [Methanosarcinales archaeon]
MVIKAINLTAECAEERERETKLCVLRVLCGEFKPLKNRDDKRDVYFGSPKVGHYNHNQINT